MTPKKLGKLGSVMRVLNNEIDGFVGERCDAATRDGYKIRCAPGCATCCHILPTCSLVEIIELVRCVTEGEHASEFGDKFIQIIEDASIVMRPDVTTAAWFDEHRRCTFLGSDDRCIAYESRPLVCRAYCVVSEPGLCLAHSSARVMIVDTRGQYPHFWDAFDCVALGFGIPDVHAPLPYLLPLAMMWIDGLEDTVIAALKSAGADNKYAWLKRWSKIETEKTG